jgi:hypothetical protein
MGVWTGEAGNARWTNPGNWIDLSTGAYAVPNIAGVAFFHLFRSPSHEEPVQIARQSVEGAETSPKA